MKSRIVAFGYLNRWMERQTDTTKSIIPPLRVDKIKATWETAIMKTEFHILLNLPERWEYYMYGTLELLWKLLMIMYGDDLIPALPGLALQSACLSGWLVWSIEHNGVSPSYSLHSGLSSHTGRTCVTESLGHVWDRLYVVAWLIKTTHTEACKLCQQIRNLINWRLPKNYWDLPEKFDGFMVGFLSG